MKRPSAVRASRVVAAAFLAVGASLFGLRPAASAPDAGSPPATCGARVFVHRFLPRVMPNWAGMLEYRRGLRGKSNAAARAALCAPAPGGSCNTSRCSKRASLLWTYPSHGDAVSDLVLERKDGKLVVFPGIEWDGVVGREFQEWFQCPEDGAEGASTIDVLATTPLVH